MRSRGSPSVLCAARPVALAFVGWSLAVAAAGCSSDKDRVEKQLKKLEDDIRHLQSETDRMGERLDAVETRPSGVPHYPEERVANASTTVTRPKLKIVRVEPGGDGPTGEPADEPDVAPPEADSGPRVLIQGEGKSIESRTLPASASAPLAAKTAKPEGTKAPKAESSKAPRAESQKAPKPAAEPAK